MLDLEKRIIEVLSSSGGALQLNEISKELKIKSDSIEYDELKLMLSAMVDSGQLVKSSRRRYKMKSAYNSGFKGTLHIHHGRGIVNTADPLFSKIIIKQKNFNTALDGDLVKVKITIVKKGEKPFGEVIEVLERAEHKITGKIEHDNGVHYLIPDEKKYYVDFLVHDKHLNKAVHGDKVSAVLDNWTDFHRSPSAKVLNIVGSSGTPGVEYDAILEEFNLPPEFPLQVLEEASKYKSIKKSEFKNRLDLRKELVITIDPKDAKDFDDALSLKKLDNGNYLVGVHIADVSHYVTENSEIDIEARNRGNSVYLVDRVVPMIPENLSNNLCSLRPDEERLAFSVMIELNSESEVADYSIHETVILSKRRYNYDEVQEIFNTGAGDNYDYLCELNRIAKELRHNRFENGGVEFETTEVRFELDEDKHPIRAYQKRGNEATQLIEEFMLLANKVVVSHLKVMSKEQNNLNYLPYLYRIHEQPEPNVISEALRFVGDLVAKNYKRKEITSKEINAILHQFKGTSEETIVSQILIRSLPKAIYSQDNVGHFGLGFREYTHFTSPIRRYADLVVHRLIKEYSTTKLDKTRLDYLKVFVRSAAQHITQTERLALEAERASIKLTHAIICKSKVGEEFFGTVSGVTNFGVFIIIDDLYAEGLLKVRDINDDYYYYDEKTMKLIGKGGKKIFKLGTRVKVRLKKVFLEKRQIDFDYLQYLG